VQVRLNYREPRITKPEPDVPDNLTEREPKSAMIASPAADNLKPLHLVPLPPAWTTIPTIILYIGTENTAGHA